jgi:GST-like protein
VTTQTKPIELHYWPTPNGHKITIMLEELGVPYQIRFVNIGRGEQFRPEFLAIAPNNRMPAIVDPEGPDGQPISVFESAAILMYLGRKFGRFYPAAERQRVQVEEWLMWQMGGPGPMFGQYNHFARYAPEKLPYAIKRYGDETHRLYRVLDKQLEGREFVAGDYSIADMALIGWLRKPETREIDIAEFPNVGRWIETLEARPAVARALAITATTPPVDLSQDEEGKKILFGQR